MSKEWKIKTHVYFQKKQNSYIWGINPGSRGALLRLRILKDPGYPQCFLYGVQEKEVFNYWGIAMLLQCFNRLDYGIFFLLLSIFFLIKHSIVIVCSPIMHGHETVNRGFSLGYTGGENLTYWYMPQIRSGQINLFFISGYFQYI